MDNNLEFGIDCPEDFKDPKFRVIDELLRCPICCEVMTTATLNSTCSHNFCSLCIRRHLELRKECPTCKAECTEGSLINNKLINDLTPSYKSIRDTLVNLDIGFESKSNKVRRNSDAIEDKEKENRIKNNLLSSMKITKSRITCTPVKSLAEPSSYEIVSPEEKERDNSQSDFTGKSQCPVCSVEVNSNKINLHLDMCLKRKTREESQQNENWKKLPSLAWSLLKEKQLKDYCKKYSLPYTGKKPELIKRLKEYTLRYNSQTMFSRKTDREIAQEVTRAENIRLLPVPGIVSNLKTEKDRKDYSRKHETQFAKLIETAKKTRNGKMKQKTGSSQDSTDVKIIKVVAPSPERRPGYNLLDFYTSPKKPQHQQQPKQMESPRETKSHDLSTSSSKSSTTSPPKTTASPLFSPVLLTPCKRDASEDGDLFDFDLDIEEIMLDDDVSQETTTCNNPIVSTDETDNNRICDSVHLEAGHKPQKGCSVLEEMYNSNSDNVIHDIDKQYTRTPAKSRNSSVSNKIDNLLEQSFHDKAKCPTSPERSHDITSQIKPRNISDEVTMVTSTESMGSSLPNGQIAQQPPDTLPSLEDDEDFLSLDSLPLSPIIGSTPPPDRVNLSPQITPSKGDEDDTPTSRHKRTSNSPHHPQQVKQRRLL